MIDPLVLWIVGLSLLAVPLFGWFASRKDEAEFISAGRRITLPVFVASLVCTWYGGILGVGEFTWSYGLVNWLALGAFYYLFALCYAYWIAPRVRQAGELSIPERIGERHGPAAGRLAGVYTWLMVSPAPYLLMAAVLLQAALGLSLESGLGWALMLTLFYTWRGGLRSVLLTDVLQFVMMFAAFGIVAAWLVSHYGGIDFLRAALPAGHLRIPGELPWSSVMLWGLVAMWTLVDPGFHQRVAVAKDVPTARRGIFISVGFWLVFDGLTTACGLYARALLPELQQPVQAFPALAGLMPPLLQGIFFAGMLVTVLSTLDSVSFLSGQTLARDLFCSRGKAQVFHTRLGILASCMIGVVLALRIPSVVELWVSIASLGIPVLLPVLLQSYLGKEPLPRGKGLRSMTAGAVTSLAWFAWGQAHAAGGWPRYPLGLEPLFPGLAASALLLLLPHKQPSART